MWKSLNHQPYQLHFDVFAHHFLLTFPTTHFSQYVNNVCFRAPSCAKNIQHALWHLSHLVQILFKHTKCVQNICPLKFLSKFALSCVAIRLLWKLFYFVRKHLHHRLAGCSHHTKQLLQLSFHTHTHNCQKTSSNSNHIPHVFHENSNEVICFAQVANKLGISSHNKGKCLWPTCCFSLQFCGTLVPSKLCPCNCQCGRAQDELVLSIHFSLAGSLLRGLAN